MNRILLLLGAVLFFFQAKAQPGNEYLNLRIVDEKQNPVFGVYVSLPRKMIFLTASNIDGECLIGTALLSSTDTLEFQGIGYLSQKKTVGEVFRRLPQLLDIAQAHHDLSRYMKLEDQFKVHHNIPYYPENYLLDSDIDVKERANYLKNLYDTRRRLFDLFNSPAFSAQEPHRHPRPNK